MHGGDLRVPPLGGADLTFERSALMALRADVALREEILPLRIVSTDGARTITVAVENASDVTKQMRCKQLFPNVKVAYQSAPIGALRAALKSAYPNASVAIVGAQTSPGVRLRERVYEIALDRHSSDIHIEAHQPYDENGIGSFEGRVMMNLDGQLRDVTRVVVRDVYGPDSALQSIPRVDFDQLVNSQKAIANMDSDFALPLSGGYSFLKSGRPISLRIESWQSIAGNNLVMRVNDQSRPPLRIDQLGMSEAMREQVEEILELPAAFVLTCGQTESGKNWTNYAFLLEIMRRANGTKGVQTLENPVELRIPGAIQNEINVKVGRTWEVELESIMRRNPKVIYIAETRSEMTARVAKDAAQAGQFVFSTLHCTSAIQAIDRLHRGLHLTRDDIASTVTVLIAQRLVRKLCSCSVEAITPEVYRERLRRLGAPVIERSRVPRGCDACFHTGYSSRTGVFEMIPFTDDFREMVADASIPTVRLARYARENLGYKPLIYDGLRHVADGTTSFEELFASVTGWRVQPETAIPLDEERAS